MNIHISFECGISLFIQLYNTFKAAAGAALDVYFCTDVQGIVSMDSGPGQHIHNILLLSASSVIVYPSFVWLPVMSEQRESNAAFVCFCFSFQVQPCGAGHGFSLRDNNAEIHAEKGNIHRSLCRWEEFKILHRWARVATAAAVRVKVTGNNGLLQSTDIFLVTLSWLQGTDSRA